MTNLIYINIEEDTGMIKKKIVAIVTLVMLSLSMLAVPAMAQNTGELTVIGKLSVAERSIYGASQTGSLIDRITKLEQDLYGHETRDAVLPRNKFIHIFSTPVSIHRQCLLS